MPADNQALIEFFGRNKRRLLAGKVHVQGRAIETSKRRVTKFQKPPLFFEPELTTAETDSTCLPALLQYLETYKPVTPRGLLFFPSGEFSLYQHDRGLNLYLRNPLPWYPAEEVKVIDCSAVDDCSVLEANILALDEHSSFVFGRLVERVDEEGYIILRRYTSILNSKVI